MRFERGPFGRIAVFSLDRKEDMIFHVMDSLRNHILPSVLPVYLREQFGQKEFCVDCTGCEQMSTCSSDLTLDPAAKRKAITDFLLALSDAEDHFIDPHCFLFEPESVFFEPETKKLLWCCLPVVQDTMGPEGETCFPAAKLERLLMHSFFADVIDDDERSRIMCLMKDGREQELKSLLNGISASPQTSVQAPRPSSVVLLSIQVSLMALSGCALALLSLKPDQAAAASRFRGWYLLIFSVMLLLNVICTGGKRSPASPETGKVPESPGLSRKEMYFPEPKTAVGESSWTSEDNRPSPAFLNQIVPTGTENGKKGIRSLIWTDDFLIGRDQILCDLFLDDPSISDRHARIIRRGVLFLIMDLGSSDGTFIGSRRLYSHEESPLADGDILTMGKLKFLFNQN